MKKVICFLSMKKKKYVVFRQTYQSQLRRDSLSVLGVPVESQESVQLRHHNSHTDVESEEVSQAIADGTKQLDFNQGVNIPCEKQKMVNSGLEKHPSPFSDLNSMKGSLTSVLSSKMYIGSRSFLFFLYI